MVNASVGNFLVVGFMAAVFILLLKSMTTVIPNDGINKVILSL